MLDEAELAFTFDEAIELFGHYGLSEEHARVAMPLTNGRADAIAQFAITLGRAGSSRQFLVD